MCERCVIGCVRGVLEVCYRCVRGVLEVSDRVC